MWNTVVSHGRWGALALSLSLSGCTALCDAKYELGQKIRTSQAWHEFDGCNEQCFTCDYRSGWKAGFYDVATGGDGRPPVIAPHKYWKPPVFVEHDPSRQDDWYRGFQDGACCAKSQPDFHYLKTFLPETCEPEHFPLHGIVPDTPSYMELQESAPFGEESGTQPEPSPGDQPAGPASNGQAPATNGAPGAPGSNGKTGQDYEKDPDPTSPEKAELEAPEPSTTMEMRFRALNASGPSVMLVSSETSSESLLDRLVQNASQPSDMDGEQ
jgi:hypothetical protein